MYLIRILDAATRELAKLDAATARRMVNRVRWLAENLDEIKPEAFTGNLAGFNKMRVGDFRVVYEIVHSEQSSILWVTGGKSIGTCRGRGLGQLLQAGASPTAPPVRTKSLTATRS